MTWLGMGYSDGKAKEAERPDGWKASPAGVRARIVPKARLRHDVPQRSANRVWHKIVERPGNINRSEGRQGRKVDA